MESELAAPPATFRLGFAGLDRESTIARLPVRGRLPAWLNGTLIRNGPGRFAIGTQRYRHWFDGLAMLHRFGIAGGHVSYTNRFLRSPAFVEAERSRRIVCSEFATHPNVSPLGRIAAMLRSTRSHNANVNVVPYGADYLALTETPSPVLIDAATLATHGVCSWNDAVPGQITTAHPLHDDARACTFNLVTEVGRTSTYRIVRIDDGTLRRTPIGSLVTDEPAYMHAFSMTARYVVIAEYPLVVRPLDLLLMRKPFIDNYRWQPARGVRFHVFKKDGGGRTASFDADAFFAFHHVNAFEEGDAIVVDLCAYDDPAIIGDFLLDRALGVDAVFTRPRFRRYRLTPGASTAQRADGESQLELPRFAPARAAAEYRFAYGVDAHDDRRIFDRVVKYDVRERREIVWSESDAYPGEPIFATRPGAVDEDDGVLLSVVLDGASHASYLLVLDARSLTELARADVPHHIPFGFHGLFQAA